MKKFLFLGLFLSLASVNCSTSAEEYIFACKNSWQQEVEVAVTSDSVDEARKFLKTDKQHRRDVSQCSYRRENFQAKPKALSDKLEDSRTD